ncbi:MAG: hypothetical protein ACRD3W_20390 [Terriglobales bacterium]
MTSCRLRVSLRKNRGAINELPLALLTLLIFAVFPVLNLVSLAVAGTVVCLLTHQQASQASVQPTYAQAMNAVGSQSKGLFDSGFARLCKIEPVGGVDNCGTNLYVQATDYRKGGTTRFGPNAPLPPPIDTHSFVYEYLTESAYNVGPFVKVPFFNDVPGLGKPATIRFSAHRAVEYPAGLVALSGTDGLPLRGGASGISLSVPGAGTPGSLGDPSGSGWNFPNIYEIIARAGEKVVDEDVLLIQANNNAWTQTSLSIVAGDKVWIDYQAVGTWYTGPNSLPLNANGDPRRTNSLGNIGSMLGQLGQSGTPFPMGNQLWNYPPPGSGPLYMAMNAGEGPSFKQTVTNAYNNNTGYMIVRVIIAR